MGGAYPHLAGNFTSSARCVTLSVVTRSILPCVRALALLFGLLLTSCANVGSDAFPTSGAPSSPALAPRILIDRAWARAEPAAAPRALAVVAFAAAQVGKPYCWGGTGPRCFDCSGLAESAWQSVGVWGPRTADAITDALPE